MNPTPPSIQSGRARGRARYRMTIAVAVLLPVTIALGVWQLERAEQKRIAQDRLYDALAAPAFAPGADPGADLGRLRLVGTYGEHSFLVDNRTHEGAAGYWVVTSFAAVDGRRWLINRGWLAAGPDRSILPVVPDVAGRVEIVALLWPLASTPPLLSAEPGWPSRVQGVEPAAMGRLFDAVPRELRLEAGQPGALAPLPLVTGPGPERHHGYAVQWFGLALVLAVGYVVFRRRLGR